MAKVITFTVLSVCMVLVSACSRDTPDKILDNYLYRLSNVLDVEKPSTLPIEIRPLFPLRRERSAQTQEIREGLLDTLKLRKCGLLPLIAERNSSLGKVLQPSLKMQYELKFLSGIEHCLENFNQAESTDTELMQLLQQVRTIKRANLAAELWNGIYTSPAIEANFSRKQTPLPLESNGSHSLSLTALLTLSNLISEISDNQPLPSGRRLSQLESHYEILFKNETGSQVFTSVQLMTEYLIQASKMLNQRLNQRPLCPNGVKTEKAEILYNVFLKFYIGEVQPYLAQVHHIGEPWLHENNKLLDSFRKLGHPIPESVSNYAAAVLSTTAEDSLWNNYIQARDNHTRSWQQILKQCGMMPSQNNRQ